MDSVLPCFTTSSSVCKTEVALCKLRGPLQTEGQLLHKPLATHDQQLRRAELTFKWWEGCMWPLVLHCPLSFPAMKIWQVQRSVELQQTLWKSARRNKWAKYKYHFNWNTLLMESVKKKKKERKRKRKRKKKLKKRKQFVSEFDLKIIKILLFKHNACFLL